MLTCIFSFHFKETEKIWYLNLSYISMSLNIKEKKHLATYLAFNTPQEFVFKLSQHKVNFFVRQFYRS